jgi:hypothetical protein
VDRMATAKTKEAGWFAMCGVPAGFAVSVRSAAGTDSSGYVDVQLPAGGVRHVTLLVGHGTGRLIGRVVDDKGMPVANASAGVWGTETEGRTNDRGTFVIDSVRSGTRTIEVRAIGFAPATIIAQIIEGDATDIRIALEKVVLLPAVEAKAEMVFSRNMVEFERHSRTSIGGRFIRPMASEGKQYQDLVSMIRALPGIEVTSRDGNWTALMKGTATYLKAGTSNCAPLLVLDGRRTLLNFDDLQRFIRPEQILGVEVYSRWVEVPHEYMDIMNQPCGAIAVWTKPPAVREMKADPAGRPPVD